MKRGNQISKKLGLTPVQYEKRLAFQRMRCQALFRKEPFHLTLEDFYTLWTDELWANRGMSKTNLVMTRKDWSGEWTVANTIIVERQHVFEKEGQAHRGKIRGPYKPRTKQKQLEEDK